MKRFYLLFIILLLLSVSCKSAFKSSEYGSFNLVNYSNKVIEFVWIAKEGEFYPTGKSINIAYGGIYELSSLEVGVYDIAVDFKDEYNSFNSKKDKTLCLTIEKGIKKIWVVDSSGNIVRN